MFTFFLCTQIILSLLLIGAVMLQQGKGADLGAALGGNSSSVFGAAGANNLLVKVTVIMAVLFMASSVFLIRAFQERRNDVGRYSAAKAANPLAGSVTEELAAAQAAAAKNVIQVTPAVPVVPAGGADKNATAPISGEGDKAVAPQDAAQPAAGSAPASAPKKPQEAKPVAALKE